MARNGSNWVFTITPSTICTDDTWWIKVSVTITKGPGLVDNLSGELFGPYADETAANAALSGPVRAILSEKVKAFASENHGLVTETPEGIPN